jgi:MtN3 and saliva related transmembrane protein
MNPIEHIASVHSIAQIVSILFGLGLFLNALIFVPQAIAIWRARTAKGVSILTFAGFNVMQAIGVAHGYFAHDLALSLGMLASLVTCGTVTGLAIAFRSSTPSG